VHALIIPMNAGTIPSAKLIWRAISLGLMASPTQHFLML
jgi:hypothetical protein